MSATQSRFKGSNAGFVIGSHMVTGLFQPSIFAFLLVYFAPASHDSLAQVVFAANLGHALFAALQSTNDLQLELTVKGALGCGFSLMGNLAHRRFLF
jgi:hypothetical protein